MRGRMCAMQAFDSPRPVLAGADDGKKFAVPADAINRVLFCLSESEIKAFLEGEPLPAFPNGIDVCSISPPTDDAQWRSLLLKLRPTVIVGAWSLPTIPDDLWRALPEFRYLCYLCGSVRQKISRRFIDEGGMVTNWGDLAARTVAECALMLVLACLRRTTRYAFEMHVEKSWHGFGEPPPQSLFGRRVGIHGFGSVARALANLLAPFGCRLEFWSDGVAPEIIKSYGLLPSPGLAELFAGNDVVIEAEAWTPKTEHSVTADCLLAMKPGSVFVNVGRGCVLAPGAIEALAVRRDVSIGLDVYDVEPLPSSSPLRGENHITLLPHTAGPTLDQYRAIRLHQMLNLDTFLRGEAPAGLIDAAQYERMT